MKKTASKKRAVKDDDKRLKRDRLLKAAGVLIKRTPMENVSMIQIAQRAGVAKGTLYLYFKTKEELFLEIHRQDYETWFGAFTDHLRELPAGADADDIVPWMLESLRANERFLRLLATVQAMLEKNVGFECARDLKLTIRSCALAASPELMRIFGIPEEESFALLAHIHALFIGLWHNAVPANVVKRVYASDPEVFSIFQMDYYEILEHSLRFMFRGLRTAD